MDTELQRLFHELADLPPAEREKAFQELGTGPALRAELESLLSFDRDGSEMLTGLVGETVEQFLDAPPEKFCGPYELVRLIGQGGMGSVFLAQRNDGEVDLRVAVKLIRNGGTTLAFHDRFLKERQILASLNHPGITRLLDAGHTPSGQPYLVMEFVDGAPIDVYCRNFSPKAKVKLFLLVCDAIAYLHRNLVIHRDLKPSNILVEPAGYPKILDFGIARILDEGADNGVTRERALTPAYASPEQVKGTAKTTATDVYSLGVVLYELLAGRLPFAEVTGKQSIEEAICSVDAPPLSRIAPAVPRDLDFVIRKAMRKEPPERYPTVDAFADDLRAVLESRPVTARSADAWYRMRKFARRYWLPVSAAAAVILSLSTGLYVASREKAVAQRRFAQLRRLSNRVLVFDEEIRGLPGSTKAREEIISLSKEYLDGLSREARNDIDIKLDAANGYLLTAEIQGVPTSPALGKFEEAEASLAKAAALVDDVLASAPNRVDALLLASEIEQDRTIVADTVHDPAGAQNHAIRTTAYVDRLTKLPAISRDQRLQAARIYLNIGQALMNLHLYSDAAAVIGRGVDMARSVGSSPWVVAQGLSALANARRQAGDLDGALSTITEARAIGEKSGFENEMLRVSALYAIWYRQGLILGDAESVSLNRPAEAVEPLQKAFDLVDQFAAKDPNDVSFRDRVGTSGLQLGDALRHADPARALEVFDHALLRIREMKGGGKARAREAKVLAHSSYPLRALHRAAEAKRRIDRAFELLRQDRGGEWDDTMRASADYEVEAGHPEQARAILLDLYAHLQARHPNPETDLLHANEMSRLYESLERVGTADEAKKFAALRANLWRQWDQKLPGNPFIRRQLR